MALQSWTLVASSDGRTLFVMGCSSIFHCMSFLEAVKLRFWRRWLLSLQHKCLLLSRGLFTDTEFRPLRQRYSIISWTNSRSPRVASSFNILKNNWMIIWRQLISHTIRMLDRLTFLPRFSSICFMDVLLSCDGGGTQIIDLIWSSVRSEYYNNVGLEGEDLPGDDDRNGGLLTRSKGEATAQSSRAREWGDLTLNLHHAWTR
jgi:hypothetical protein